jgi:hypothetical protein
MNNPNQSKALQVIVIVLAVIGALTVLGAAGMAVMHGSMMAGMGC